jgi:hypothetical protein
VAQSIITQGLGAAPPAELLQGYTMPPGGGLFPVPTQYVIVIGGIGGNQLYIPGPNHTLADLIWLNYTRIAVKGLALMRLADDGVHQYDAGQPDLIPALVLAEYYGRLSDYLAKLGMVPLSFVQDWRPTIASVVPDLLRQIADLSASLPVHVVAHSNGGLVIREALNQMTQADRASRIGRVVGVGVPHYGAWSATQFLAGLNQTMCNIGWIRAAAGGVLPELLGQTPINTVLGSWPTGYEMLPSPAAPGITPLEIDRVYGDSGFRRLSWVLPKWIDYARTRWAGARAVPSDVQWMDIVGTGTTTPVGVKVSAVDATTADAYLYSTEGDGAVPRAWALSGRGNVILSNAGHTDMIGSAAVHDAIGTFLRGG